MQNFSGAILISDMDDFIRPSQECIKPVVIEKKPGRTRRRIEIDQDSGKVCQVDDDGEVSKPKAIQLKKVEITLADCLACSGCVTSAESFLVNQQSVTEILSKIQSRSSSCRKQIFVASISNQTYVSFAAQHSVDLATASRRLSAALRKIGFDLVYDTGCAQSVSLIASCREFVEKNKHSKFPIFASHCPGWICYAEKTAGSNVLPHISTVKSAQQILGTLVKRMVAKRLGFSPEDVFHVALMPCYDKKLEASREDFGENDSTNARHVDSVLTSGEIGQLLEQCGVKFDSNFIEENDFDLPVVDVRQHFPLTHFGSGSGGYAEHILRYAAKEIGGLSDDQLVVHKKSIRNEDMIELSIDGFPTKFAIANGFRNIQNVVHKFKTSPQRFQWSYVEMMACPTGCLGGGGQLPISLTQETSNFRANREMVSKIKHIFYEAGETAKIWAWDEPLGKEIFQKLNDDGDDNVLFTSYNAVEQTVTSILKW